jgi:hypothetical protein
MHSHEKCNVWSKVRTIKLLYHLRADISKCWSKEGTPYISVNLYNYSSEYIILLQIIERGVKLLTRDLHISITVTVCVQVLLHWRRFDKHSSNIHPIFSQEADMHILTLFFFVGLFKNALSATKLGMIN